VYLNEGHATTLILIQLFVNEYFDDNAFRLANIFYI